MNADREQDLLHACSERNIERICELVELGANPNVKNGFGDTPLILLANSHGHIFPNIDFTPALSALLAADAKIDQKCRKDGLTPLFSSVEVYNENIARFLIEQGADVNAKDRKGKTVLMTALMRTQEKIVHSLIDHGASVHAVSRASRHVISYLCGNVSVGLIQRLVEAGANPRDDYCLCLWQMIESQNWEAARELVRLGAMPV